MKASRFPIRDWPSHLSYKIESTGYDFLINVLFEALKVRSFQFRDSISWHDRGRLHESNR